MVGRGEIGTRYRVRGRLPQIRASRRLLMSAPTRCHLCQHRKGHRRMHLKPHPRHPETVTNKTQPCGCPCHVSGV